MNMTNAACEVKILDKRISDMEHMILNKVYFHNTEISHVYKELPLLKMRREQIIRSLHDEATALLGQLNPNRKLP